VKFYIIFLNDKNIPDNQKKWWNKFLNINYKHCFIIQVFNLFDGKEIFVVLENLYNSINIEISCIDIEDLPSLVDNLTCIVEYNILINPYKKQNIEPITCVTIIKKLIGLKNIFIQTPLQLKKYLIRNGGKIIWEQ